MTTKLLGAKDVLTKEGWLLSETSREGSPYDLQVLINHKEYFPLSIVLLLSMVFVQPYNGMHPQLIFCAGLGDGSGSRGQSVFVRCFSSL